MRIAPLITFLRVIALPLIIFLVFQETAFTATFAVVVMVLAIFSDLVDGVVAKKEGKLISFFDPFADKILIVGLLLTFTILENYWVWALVLFIARDVIVAVLRIVAGREDMHLSGGLYGKIMIAAQYVIILAILLQSSLDLRSKLTDVTSNLLGILVLLFTCVGLIIAFASIIHYLMLFKKKLRLREIQHTKRKHIDLVVLANKRSRGFYNRYRRRLLRLFSRRRNAKMIYLPKNKDMYKGCEIKIPTKSNIIIAGGDGSFESALNYPPLHKKSLGFFPFGAGNAYYSYFYKGKRFEYLRERFHFEEREIDVFELEWDSHKRQTMFIGVGIDASVIEKSTTRSKHGFIDYVKGSLKTAISGKGGYDLTCTIDGVKHHWANAFNVIFAKIPYLGFGIRSFPKKIKGNNGLIYCLAGINPHSGIFNKPLRAWALILSVLGFQKAPLFLLKGKKMILKSETPFPIHAGGEFLGWTKKVSLKVIRTQKVLMI